MNHIKKSDISTLERRMNHLAARMEKNQKADTGFHYDRAEFFALKRVLQYLAGAGNAEESNVQDKAD